MKARRRTLTLGSAAVLILSAALSAQTTPQPKKMSDAEKKEVQTIQKLVDDAAVGQPAPNDLGLAWSREDLLKDYPYLELEDIRQALSYAAWLTREEVIPA